MLANVRGSDGSIDGGGVVVVGTGVGVGRLWILSQSVHFSPKSSKGAVVRADDGAKVMTSFVAGAVSTVGFRKVAHAVRNSIPTEATTTSEFRALFIPSVYNGLCFSFLTLARRLSGG